MGIFNFLKKKRQVTGVSVDGLPPLPIDATPLQDSSYQGLIDPITQTPLSSIDSSQDQLPSQEMHYEPEFDQEVFSQDEATLTEPTQPTEQVPPPVFQAKADTQASDDLALLTTPANSTEQIQESEPDTPPTFEVPTNFSELDIEEIFINKQEYIQLLGNIDLLKNELKKEEQSSEELVDATALLQESIKKSLACEALIAKMEEHISFQGE